MTLAIMFLGLGAISVGSGIYMLAIRYRMFACIACGHRFYAKAPVSSEEEDDDD